MALSGKLEDVRPAEILLFLAMSEKTGKLNFTTGTQEGMIVFRGGKIIYAASSSIRETFGSIALSLQIVNREQLEKALFTQNQSREDKRLGEILVEIGAMTQFDLEKVLIHQVGQVVLEMFEWESGYFRFRNLAIEEFGDVQVDARDFIVESPLDTRTVALDAARLHDETPRDLVETVDGDGDGRSPEKASVAQMMIDVAAPALTAETIREIFEVASKVFSRGVVFAVHSHSVRGLAQFGLIDTDIPPSQRIRQIWLPKSEISVITTVAGEGKLLRGAPEHNHGNQILFEVLGGLWPVEGVTIPMLINGQVALIFYGDNEPDNLPVGSTFALEETLKSVGRRLAKVIQ